MVKDQEFEKYLERIEDPRNQSQINRNLSTSATPLQILKYKLCKKILGYKLENNLTRKQIAERINLSKAEVEDILFCEIEKFTLDRLLTYASQLFFPAEVDITFEPKKNTSYASV